MHCESIHPRRSHSVADDRRASLRARVSARCHKRPVWADGPQVLFLLFALGVGDFGPSKASILTKAGGSDVNYVLQLGGMDGSAARIIVSGLALHRRKWSC